MKRMNIILSGFLCVILIANTFSQEYEYFMSGGNSSTTLNSPVYVPDVANNDVYLDLVPKYGDSYGYAPVSTSMLVGYYDRTDYDYMYTGSANGGIAPPTSMWEEGENPIAATHMGVDGRDTRGHVDDYWGETVWDPDPYIVNNWPEHEWEDCTGDFMGTSQDYWFQDVLNYSDGITTFYFETHGYKVEDYISCEYEIPPRKDGCHGLREFVESRGYTVLENYNQLIYGYFEDMEDGFTFENYKNEIDNGRPVIIHLFPNVSVVGAGYNTDDNTVLIHNGFDSDVHSMTWGGTYANMESYGVTVIKLKPVVPGINDYVEFINNPPTILEMNKPSPPYQYEAQFVDLEEPSNPVWWEFTLALYHDNGEYQLLFDHDDETWNSNYWYIPTITELPQFNWSRNIRGNIRGYAKVEVLDSDGFLHSDIVPIELLYGPPKPYIVGAHAQNNSLFVSYITMGGPQYKIYYDVDPGPPYNGTGAIQGSSPIDAGNLTTFEISGLPDCNKYYFAVKAQNEYGESIYSEEVEIPVVAWADPNEILRYHFNDLIFDQNMYNYDIDGQPLFQRRPNCPNRHDTSD